MVNGLFCKAIILKVAVPYDNDKCDNFTSCTYRGLKPVKHSVLIDSKTIDSKTVFTMIVKTSRTLVSSSSGRCRNVPWSCYWQMIYRSQRHSSGGMEVSRPVDVSISSSDSHTNIIVILGTAAAPAAVMELQSAEIRLISFEPISHGISTHTPTTHYKTKLYCTMPHLQ